MKMRARMIIPAGMALAFVLALCAIALASNGNPSATVPSSGNTTPGTAASMFGSASRGLTVFNASCASCHGPAGQPTLAYPGIASVQNTNTNYSIDPELYDPNPARFALNIDPFIQHGSNPGGVPAPMPSFGDSGILTQSQIADVEAYVMSLSNVNWPTLALNGTTLNGSGFVPQTTIQLYNNSTAFGSTINADASGKLSTSFSAPAGQSGTITAKYAVLDEYGIYPNGDPSQGNLAMDGTRTATLAVATVGYSAAAAATAPATTTTVTTLPNTGSDVLVLILASAMLTIMGSAVLLRRRGSS